MTTSDARVTVLVCEASGLVIGVDSGDVYAVISSAGSEHDRVLAGELFGRPVRTSAAARTLVMRSSSGSRVVVDRVLGIRSLSAGELRPIPASMRALGVADWVLGLAELEQGFVWLLDLAWAIPEPEAERLT
jgi:hypothetical protein